MKNMFEKKDNNRFLCHHILKRKEILKNFTKRPPFAMCKSLYAR